MKKVLYFAVVLIIALCVYLVPDWEGEDVSDGVVLEEAEGLEQAAIETIEEKAYRVETTPVPAPEDYDIVSKEIWELQENLREDHTRILTAAGKDFKKFSKDWRAYNEKNQSIYKRVIELREQKYLGATREKILSTYGKDSQQYTQYHTLIEQISKKELTSREFYQKLRKIK